MLASPCNSFSDFTWRQFQWNRHVFTNAFAGGWYGLKFGAPHSCGCLYTGPAYSSWIPPVSSHRSHKENHGTVHTFCSTGQDPSVFIPAYYKCYKPKHSNFKFSVTSDLLVMLLWSLTDDFFFNTHEDRHNLLLLSEKLRHPLPQEDWRYGWMYSSVWTNLTCSQTASHDLRCCSSMPQTNLTEEMKFLHHIDLTLQYSSWILQY